MELSGNEKNHIIASSIEHPAVLKVINKIRSFGITSSLASVDKDGTVDLDFALNLINDNTGLFSIMLANNEVGNNPTNQRNC